MLVAQLSLNACTTANYSQCPTFPIAGKDVAVELEKIPYEQAPNFWEWLGRIDKLKQELDLCK